MDPQIPSRLIAIRPHEFGVNPETSESNKFQKSEDQDKVHISKLAQDEFDRFVSEFRSSDIPLMVLEEERKGTPDAVFPNNWISFHEDGTVVIYPMESKIRRKERRYDLLSKLQEDYLIKQIIDLSCYESRNKFLESTGSIVFDYPNRTGYICRSSRSSEEVINSLFNILDFEPVLFNGSDRDGNPIYHTNVMMCIGNTFAVACLECIPDPGERKLVAEKLKSTGHEIIEISMDQVYNFAGNMLQVNDRSGNAKLIMSESAHSSLNSTQVDQISRHSEIVSISIPTIEKYGGGSIRCMLAGIMLPFKNSNN